MTTGRINQITIFKPSPAITLSWTR